MIKFIDDTLNRITMYRLVLYYLISLVGAALVLCVLKILPYNPLLLLFSTTLLIGLCWATNTVFAKTYKVPANIESAYISALILALIITPPTLLHDLAFLFWAAVLAMASKYILAINGKHIFNPVALAVAVIALTVNQTASWWVGTLSMLPLVLVGGLLIVRKTRRFDLVVGFLGAALVTTLIFGFMNGSALLPSIQNLLIYSPLLFFAFVILTEPLTLPATDRNQIYYGVLVGILFSPETHIGAIYLTPELAILMGNIFSYIVNPKAKLILTLREKARIAPDVYDFVFTPNQKLSFAPGQYMEWTLGHPHPDSRGNRRFFTLASAPTENDLRLGVKFYDQSSSFKKSMLAMDNRTEIVASQLAGDFVLPEDPNRKCVLIAGGIGVTPYRSMIKYLLDTKQRRRIVLFYVNSRADEIVYKDVFDRAGRELGIKTVYTLTDKKSVPAGWMGRVGYLTPQMIKVEVPDYRNYTFYISGPNAMVESVQKVLLLMRVKRENIKKDFFPGLA